MNPPFCYVFEAVYFKSGRLLTTGNERENDLKVAKRRLKKKRASKMETSL